MPVICHVPGDMLACEARPAKPAGIDLPADHPNTATDQDGGDFVVDLHDAGQDCRAKLAQVAEILARCRSPPQ